MTVCADCQRGVHSHDRWTSDGTDAGCPKVSGPNGQDCTCAVTVHTSGAVVEPITELDMTMNGLPGRKARIGPQDRPFMEARFIPADAFAEDSAPYVRVSIPGVVGWDSIADARKAAARIVTLCDWIDQSAQASKYL